MSEGVDRGKRQPDTRGEPVEQAGIVGQTAPTPAEGVFEALIASAQESGQLASDELTLAVDELELEPAQVDELYGRLEELHIEVVEPVEEEAEADAREVSTEALQLFLKDIGKVDLLTAPQEIELAKRIERGDHRAKQEMVEANLRLVVSIAKRYRNQGLPFLDLIQEGTIGPGPRGGEVRSPQGLQVLDLRDVVDPAGGRAGARRQGADDPHARPRGREAEQDPPHGAQVESRARSGALLR